MFLTSTSMCGILTTQRRIRALRFCDAQPFVAYRDGKVVGRVAAVINHHANETWKKKVVRFSQIDFVDDDDVSRALIEAVEQWGRSRGMDTIEGPLGITDFDKEGIFSRISTRCRP